MAASASYLSADGVPVVLRPVLAAAGPRPLVDVVVHYTTLSGEAKDLLPDRRRAAAVPLQGTETET